ncbi:MAG: NAD/NADP octopine/nopaline dehydrogenase family protein [Candidatus Binatia bacterium]
MIKTAGDDVMAKIAILGAGNGGSAAAADLTVRGHDVRLYSRSAETLEPILKRGGIETSGLLGEQFARIAKVTHDVDETVKNAEIVMLVVPGTGHEYYAKLLAPLLAEEQIVFLNPGHTGGAFLFAATLKREGCKKKIKICETNSLTYGCRLTGPAKVTVYLKAKYLLLACFPGKKIGEAWEKIELLYPALKPCVHVLETSLSYLNGILHPPGMVLNTGWIEHTRGDFRYYDEGTTPAVARVIEKVDRERMEIMKSLGLTPMSFLDIFFHAGYTTERAYSSGSVFQAFQESEVNKPRKAPPSLDHRYMDEDVGYGIVPMSEIGIIAGVETPVMDSLIQIASAMKQIDFRKVGLNLERLGLTGIRKDHLQEFLLDGY